MNPKTKKLLRANFPAILEHSTLSYLQGWDELMWLLCERLQFHADHNQMPPVKISEAKEKYGGLSILFSGGNSYSDGLIDMIEALSLRVCEVCGRCGSSNDGLGVELVKTRCPEHWGSEQNSSATSCNVEIDSLGQ